MRIFEGLLTNRSENRLAGVQDGSSNTLLFGEGAGRATVSNGQVIENAVAWNWMGIGEVTTKFGLGVVGAEVDNPPSRINLPGAHWSMFSSRHSGGVNFCFGDGHVKMLRFGSTTHRRPGPPNNLTTPSQDWWVLQRLAGMHDGQLANENDL